jgi:DUF1009 family protein
MQAKITKLAIIAGSGSLPIEICNSCVAKQIDHLVIALEGNAIIARYNDKHCFPLALGQVGKLLALLEEHKVSHVILAGGIKKPDFSTIKVDIKGAILLAKITAAKLLGDNHILTEVLSYLKNHGYEIAGVKDYFDELLVPVGNLTSNQPQKNDFYDIDIGKNAAEMLGRLDIGQAVIVENKVILAVEAAEGTDNLIKRAKELKFLNKKSGVLVKMVKPNQDLRVDLPTVGPETIKNIAEANLCGIAISAHHAIILDKAYTLELAKKHELFIFGIK